MLKEIIKECIKDMIKVVYTPNFDTNENLDIKSYTLKTIGKGAVYCCETNLQTLLENGHSSDKIFYIEESKVRKKIEEKRKEKLNELGIE
jgi:hypothetical protein